MMRINAYLTKSQAVLLDKVSKKTGMSRSRALREGLKLLAEKLGIEEVKE